MQEASAPAVAFQSPKYIQQAGALSRVGEWVRESFPNAAGKAGVLTSARLRARYGEILTAGLPGQPVVVEFSGECSRSNLAAVLAKMQGQGLDYLVAFGGGKLLDMAKLVCVCALMLLAAVAAIAQGCPACTYAQELNNKHHAAAASFHLQAAHELDVPVVVVPSLASTDAPCTALSVVYSDAGVVEKVVYFPRSPAMVVVDTAVIAEAPPVFLVAGMGDAMATWYEARAVGRNPAATTKIAPLSYRPPRIATAIARECAEILYEHGTQAAADCAAGRVSPALEAVVEANTLLSGLGVEAGGLALAHGLHNALTRLPQTHSLMHGQKVAFGTLVQLVLEGDDKEAARLAAFNQVLGQMLAGAR